MLEILKFGNSNGIFSFSFSSNLFFENGFKDKGSGGAIIVVSVYIVVLIMIGASAYYLSNGSGVSTGAVYSTTTTRIGTTG